MSWKGFLCFITESPKHPHDSCLVFRKIPPDDEEVEAPKDARVWFALQEELEWFLHQLLSGNSTFSELLVIGGLHSDLVSSSDPLFNGYVKRVIVDFLYLYHCSSFQAPAQAQKTGSGEKAIHSAPGIKDLPLDTLRVTPFCSASLPIS